MDPAVGADQRVDLADLVEVRHLSPREVVLRFREPERPRQVLLAIPRLRVI